MNRALLIFIFKALIAGNTGFNLFLIQEYQLGLNLMLLKSAENLFNQMCTISVGSGTAIESYDFH